MRNGNEKFNAMITEQLKAREDMRRSAEADAKVNKSDWLRKGQRS